MSEAENDFEEKRLRQREEDALVVDKIRSESEDYFEKNVTYISAGTLVLSLTFVEKIVNLKESSSIYFLITSWALMAITLAINLCSHILSSYYLSLTARAMRENRFHGLAEKIDKRNLVLRGVNIFTVASLILGMTSLIVFCSINATTMSHQPNSTRTINQPTEQRGKTIPVTSSVLQQSKPTVAAPVKPSSTQSSTNTDQK